MGCMTEKIQTIQSMAKRWKSAMLAGWVLFFVGLFIAFLVHAAIGLLVAGGGLAYAFYGRLMAWWHHG